MRTLTSILILTVTLIFTGSAFAQDATSDRDAMLSVLRGIDTVPTADAMQKRFPNGDAMLVSIATDAEQNFYVRKRATTLLSSYPTAQTAAALQTIAEDAKLRPFAVYTLARTFGDNATSNLVATVAEYLKDENSEVRAYTVRGLRWMRHEDARTALERLAQGPEEELATLARRSLKKWKAPTSNPVAP